ncbi:hypothetical protein BDZ45DRAFT_132228 [Acephala macrosclerotiorum]|nr:hypothetical protein BDZ45DRAFT_132228 [Acephala macrosclerotiorum]
MASLQRLPFLRAQIPLIWRRPHNGRKIWVLGNPCCTLSLNNPRYQYPLNTPAMQSAIPGFQQEQDPTTEEFDEPRTIQVQHAQSQQEAPNTCQECKTQFRNKARLDSHARQTQHATYACSCGETFSRFDVLNRHLDKFDPKAVYTCPYCSNYSDHRLDHLTQHLRGYHKLDLSDSTQDSQPSPPKATPNKRARTCPHEGCPYHSSTTGPSSESDENQQQIVFQMRKELTRHLREAHDESPFPCTASGCRRIGRKGFCRKRDY